MHHEFVMHIKGINSETIHDLIITLDDEVVTFVSQNDRVSSREN